MLLSDWTDFQSWVVLSLRCSVDAIIHCSVFNQQVNAAITSPDLSSIIYLQ